MHPLSHFIELSGNKLHYPLQLKLEHAINKYIIIYIIKT